jgi:hypothetical protein
MRGAISPLPQYAFMAWCLVKRRDNFTFTPICFEVLPLSSPMTLPLLVRQTLFLETAVSHLEPDQGNKMGILFH